MVSPANGRRCLVAARPGQEPGPGFERFFPDERSPAGRLKRPQIELLAREPSGLYQSLAVALGARLASRLSIPEPSARTVAREPAVLLAYVFLDRLLRLRLRVEAGGAEAWSVASPPPLEPPATLELFQAGAMDSPELNQTLLALLAPVWSLPADALLATPPPPGTAAAANLNFASPSLGRRLRWKAARVSARLLGRVPALGLAYAQSCFLDAGLIGPLAIAELAGAHARRPPAPRDPRLREETVGAAVDDSRPVFETLLESLGFASDDVRRRAHAAFRGYLCRFYPASVLEELPARLTEYRRQLARFAPRPLLFSEAGGAWATGMLAAARELGMPRIGVQHGAHYGFYAATCHLELEFVHCERFVTWGWSRFPEHPFSRGLEAIPLPSPWLSEKRSQWARELPPAGAGAREFDVLLMTDRLQRYPPPPNTLRMSRVDCLPEAAAWLDGAVRALSARGLRVLHKPFNSVSAQMLAGAVAELRAACGALYQVHERLDKGMSAELLRGCRAVVWDEPGTGLFECLVSGIPTLLLWPRDVSREAPHGEALFSALEAAGVAHREAGSLAEEAARLCAAPAAWLSEPRRARAIQEACRTYAWVEADWARRWRGFLRAL